MREYYDKNNRKDFGLPSPSDFYPTCAEAPTRSQKADSREKISRQLSRSRLTRQELTDEARRKSLFLDYRITAGRYVVKIGLGFVVDCDNDNF